MKRLLGTLTFFVAIGCGSSGGTGHGGSGGLSNGGGGDGNPGLGGAGGGVAACTTGAEGCACYLNDTCNGVLQCFSHLCVSVPGTAGTTGAAGATGSGGAASTGGSPSTGGGGGTGTAGTPGSGGVNNTGGHAPGTGGSQGAGGTTADTCSNAPAATIDNFATCDLNACDVGGRHGSWFGYSDNGINLDFAVRVPPSAWMWQACSAVVTGGPRTTGGMAYAGIGVTLNGQNPYDASGYTGVRFRLESSTRIWVGIESADGGRFGAFAPASSAVVRDVSFASMIAQADSATATKNLSTLKQVVFTPEDPSMGFGYLVGSLSFY